MIENLIKTNLFYFRYDNLFGMEKLHIESLKRRNFKGKKGEIYLVDNDAKLGNNKAAFELLLNSLHLYCPKCSYFKEVQ